MKLDEDEKDTFFDLYFNLLFYTDRKLKVINWEDGPSSFRESRPEALVKIREALFDNPEVLDSYIEENPPDLSEEKLDILSGWKDFVKEEFIVYKHLKNHTVFLEWESPHRAYGVLGLEEGIDEVVPYVPHPVKTVLLPFKGKIVYDGLVNTYSIKFGSNVKKEINEYYLKAKSKYGLITSLPFSSDEEWDKRDKLEFYLRNQHNRGKYEKEIERLIDQDPSLLSVYHKKMGKIFAHSEKKRLKEAGFSDVWFATLGKRIVASGKTKEQLEKVLEDIVPERRKDHTHLFKVG